MIELKIPDAPNSIKKGFPLKMVLDKSAVHQLGKNIKLVYPQFEKEKFISETMSEIEPLSLTQRSLHIASFLKKYLPNTYTEAIGILLRTLTKPLVETEGNGLAPMFYMPHCSFIAKYGVDAKYNAGVDPFELSIKAQYELTKRFTCEFSIRSFIIKDETRTMKVLYEWMNDTDPHVRRLCSEGTRPRLPWAAKIDSFVKNPKPSLKILEHLKNDSDLYVRRSVANHVGDIAKDNLGLALTLCESWLKGASPELKWVIRHALRNPFKKGDLEAIRIREAAKR